MKSNNLVATLRERVDEFGEKPAYILSPEELTQGIREAILQTEEPEDCGDGTIITRATFEGNTFLCITEKK